MKFPQYYIYITTHSKYLFPVWMNVIWEYLSNEYLKFNLATAEGIAFLSWLSHICDQREIKHL